jgi:serine/alanine adding enzyme
MKENITLMRERNRLAWDNFATNQRNGCTYHLAAWGDAIKCSYSHDPDYFIASRTPAGTSVSTLCNKEASNDWTNDEVSEITGILPIVHIRHWLFGNSLVSMPFCDSGGVLAADGIIERSMVEHVLNVADERNVPVVELRQYHPLSCLDDPGFMYEAEPSGLRQVRSVPGWRVSIMADNKKVRMLLDLPDGADLLMQAFDAKLRSQIRKPQKNGLVVKIGGIDLIDDFYEVFCVNMRDLGSPVHSKKFIHQVLLNYPEKARIFIVYGQGVPMACSLTLGFNRTLSNPWASSLRRYSQLAPNMLLYWAMLEYACQKNYRTFDFGRSTVGEGTYRFKEQWGAKPVSLYWYRFARDNRFATETDQSKDRMARAVELWRRLPVPVTRFLGPKIRRYISL